MILAVSGAELPPHRDTECSIRIHGLFKAYNTAEFLHFYSDGEGTSLSLLDGVAVLDAPAALSAEWLAFVSMHPEIRILRTDGATGEQIAAQGIGRLRTGKLMCFTGIMPAENPTSVPCRLPELYPLLQSGFSELPPFDSWYVDVSHRVRHGCCHMGVVMRDAVPVSAAITVAETDTAAVIGPVVTDPAFRRRGLASACLKTLLAQLADQPSIWIAPIDEYAAQLYARLGFTSQGKWAELTFD